MKQISGFVVVVFTRRSRNRTTLVQRRAYFVKRYSKAHAHTFHLPWTAKTPSFDPLADTRLQQSSPQDLLREIQRLKEENERLRKSTAGETMIDDEKVESVVDNRPLGLPLEDGRFLPFSVVDVKNPDFRIVPVIGEAELLERQLVVHQKAEIGEFQDRPQTCDQLPDTWSKCRVMEWSSHIQHVVVPSCEIIVDERRPVGVFVPGSCLKVSFTDGVDHKVLMIFETQETYLSEKDAYDGIWLWQCLEKSTLHIGWWKKETTIEEKEWKPLGRLLMCLSPKIQDSNHEAQAFLEVDEVF